MKKSLENIVVMAAITLTCIIPLYLMWLELFSTGQGPLTKLSDYFASDGHTSQIVFYLILSWMVIVLLLIIYRFTVKCNFFSTLIERSNNQLETISLKQREQQESIEQLQRIKEELEKNLYLKTQELISEKIRFQDIAYAAGDWIWEVDINGKYTFIAGPTELLLGYDRNELLKMSAFDLMEPLEAKRIGDKFKEIAKGQQAIINLVNRVKRKDGREICLLTNGLPLFDSFGKLIGYRGVDKEIQDPDQKED